MSLKRRRFLKWGLASAGGLAGGGLGVWAMQPRRKVLGPSDPSLPERAATRRRVVVVGGGLAGLTAAIELAGRNFEVTLVERAQHLGGKLGGWKVTAAGEEFPQEHGFHGFFAQYHNLAEVFEQASIGPDRIGDFPDYDVVFRDRPMDRYSPDAVKAFPFNMLSVVAHSKNLRLLDFANGSSGVLELLRYREQRTFERFDDIDFERFCAEGRINQGMVDAVLRPFGKTTLNRTARLSAAEAIRFFHFYFLGNPDGLSFRYPKIDSMAAVIDPLERRLLSLGGKVMKGMGVRSLVPAADSPRIAKVIFEGPRARLWGRARVEADKIPAEGWLAVPQGDGTSAFVTRRGDELVALDGRCAHMGCPVLPDPATGGFKCPCHAGTYDAQGKMTSGPPPRPLTPLVVTRLADGGVEIADAPVDPAVPMGPQSLDCDYCIVACDVRGVRQVVGWSPIAAPALMKGVGSLGEADPYVVWRLWLDRPTNPDRSWFYTVSRYRYTDSIALYSQLQEPYISWARRTGGSAIELHAYAIAPELVTSEGEIRRIMFDEMTTVLPELRGAKILHDEFMFQTNFTRWAPGDWKLRPETETEIPNLFLAGDHVKMHLPVSLMEGAVTSGRLAANAVLRKERVREVPIHSVALEGTLA